MPITSKLITPSVFSNPLDSINQPLDFNPAWAKVTDWFTQKGWTPFDFQQELWQHYLNGHSGLLHSTTGSGKTYAMWMGPVIQALAEQQLQEAAGTKPRKSKKRISIRNSTPPLTVLWITPLRSLATDTLQSLELPVRELKLNWSIESRTSDTVTKIRSHQRDRLPTVLLTTPESLSLLLTRLDARYLFSNLKLVVCDEWHELLSTKRGVQTELALARLRKWKPQLQVWGISATLGNTDTAMQVLMGNQPSSAGIIIRGEQTKSIHIDSLIPQNMEHFPLAGHLGNRQAQNVVEAIEKANTSLVFTNTRSQAEAWYQLILEQRPEWAGLMALHHASLDRDTRTWVEQSLRIGSLKCVVATSSLDLGVDFSPVEQVFQIGSPKGVARFLQRAGRSGHSPGLASKIITVPTHALELLEFAAARDAVANSELEGRIPLSNSIDVLAQHLVTIAMGGGFKPTDLYHEVKQTHAYRNLTLEDWQWVLDYVSNGGQALAAYPEYHKVQLSAYGDYRLDNPRLMRNHRLSIGTIVSDPVLTVQYLKGGKIGTVEEAFLTKINPGDHFVFGGKLLELVKIQDHRVWVRKAKSNGTEKFPRWMGGRMPLSSELAVAVRRKLDEASQRIYNSPEMLALQELLEIQAQWSRIPRSHELLIESTTSREGHHLYFYPFAGRLVHEGLAPLIAYRLSQLTPVTFSMSVNDYGFELLSPEPVPLEQQLHGPLFSLNHLQQDIEASMNAAEMAKRQFREVASIAGLVFSGFPNDRKSARQLQASTGLLFDVFKNYDPENLLLKQAESEVLERQLEYHRLQETLKQMQHSKIMLIHVPRFTPLSFPLMVDRLRARLSSEKISERITRMQQTLEKSVRLKQK